MMFPVRQREDRPVDGRTFSRGHSRALFNLPGETHWQILHRRTSPSSSHTTKPFSTSLFFSNSTCSNPTPVTLLNPRQTSFGLIPSNVVLRAAKFKLTLGKDDKDGRDEVELD